jgi:hypothetical protein
MKLDVLSGNALKERNLENDKTHHNQKLLCEIWFLDCVISNDDIAVSPSEDETDDWHSIQSLGVHSEGYPTCDSALEVSGVWIVNQVLDQHFTRPQEEPEEEHKVAEHKATILHALKEQEAARKCLCHFDTESSFISMCRKVENELYRLRVQGQKKQKDSY